MKGDGERYSSGGTRWKDVRWRCRVMSCSQVNTQHVTAGRGSLLFVTTSLGHERAKETNGSWQGQREREGGGGCCSRQKRREFYSFLCLFFKGSKTAADQKLYRGETGILVHLVTLHNCFVTFYKQIREILQSHSCANTWPGLAPLAAAVPSCLPPYCAQEPLGWGAHAAPPNGDQHPERTPPSGHRSTASGSSSECSEGHALRGAAAAPMARLHRPARSQHSPSAPPATCEQLQYPGPWSGPSSKACNELAKH